MRLLRRSPFQPFAARGRVTVATIIVMFALFSAVSVALSIRETSRSRHRATVVEVASRQRTLAERYVREAMLVHSGARADPALTAQLLAVSANKLIDGGVAPGVNGDDDETSLPAASGLARLQLQQARRLARDLTATGAAWLADRPLDRVRFTGKERLAVTDPERRLDVLAALTSNVSLDAARTIASSADHGIVQLIVTQVVLGVAGLLAALLLAAGLTAASRRQAAHFRSLVTASTDLVLIVGEGGCQYASESVQRVLGRTGAELLGSGFAESVHCDDRRLVADACARGEPDEIIFRLRNGQGEWRHVEAHLTDMRGQRHVRGIVLNARDISERVTLEEELTRQAFQDGLTGLANRALFRDRLDQALVRAERSRAPISLLLIDLDGFKQINDSFGHDVGDQVLVQVAEWFAEVTRTGDTVARFGGDEFAVLMEGAAESPAVALATRILERLSTPVSLADRTLTFGASIGIVTQTGEGVAGREELIRRADIAMYTAKGAGRGRYEIFHTDMDRQVGESLGLADEIRLAIERNEFTLQYQPEIEIETGAIVGAEALMRWSSPTLGMVPPSEFIPAAEEAGLIIELGRFAMQEACLQTASWESQGVLPERFVTWVNLSGTQLSGGGIDELVRAALAGSGISPRRLGLEITETSIVQGGVVGDRACGELQSLHSAGVGIAIDDFGTGFSSLEQLRRFPVDMIKIDRSFVQGGELDPRDAAITANVVSLAHALGLIAMAEGIESPAQLKSLRELGCNLAQGFLFARAMPPDDLAERLRDRQWERVPEAA